MRTAWILCAVLFAACLSVYGELFGIEYLDRMDSIEAAYISLARYVAANAPDLTWFPLWYNGVPYQNTYPPLLHWIVGGWAKLAGIPPALAFHNVVTLLFCLCPVGIFWLARRLSGSDLCAWFAGLAAAFLSPAAWLIPVVRNDVGGWLHPRRLMTLVVYGEGTHQASMTFLVFAILAIDWAVRRRTPWACLVAALLSGAAVLSNWIGAMCLVLFVAAYALSGPLRHWPRILLCCVAGATLIAPWIVPSTIRVIQRNAQTIGGDFTNVYGNLGWKAAWLVGAATLAWAGAKFRWPRHATFAAIATWLTGGITLGADWLGLALFPQPQRYHVEMELAISLGLGSLVCLAVRRLPVPGSWALTGLLTAAILPAAYVCYRYTDREVRPLAIEKTVEYEVAKVLDQKVPGCRVFLFGTVGYWNNAFTNQPNVLGGFDQGITVPGIRVAQYVTGSDDGVEPGHESEVSILWLKTFGAHAVHVGGPKSREHYKPWKHPQKFEGALEKIWQSGDDYLYRVPQRSCSLARVVPASALPAREPINGIDIEPLRPYVAALDDPAVPDAPTRWTSRHSLDVDVPKLSAGQVVSLQVSWATGWTADRGQLKKDALGQMVLEPQCGNCTVRLNYDGGVERKTAIALSLGTLTLFAAAITRRWLTSRVLSDAPVRET